MSAGILLATNAEGNALALATTIGALAAVMAVTLALLLLSHQLNRVIGITAQRVLMRVFGILLAAIAVQAMFNGLDAIGLIRLPEICSNVCFGGPKRNRLFMTASQSLYAVYVETQGAHIC